MHSQVFITIDARGLRCPLPVLRLAKVGRDAEVGTVIELLADDAAARTDVPAFVGEMRWTGVEVLPAGAGVTRYRVTR